MEKRIYFNKGRLFLQTAIQLIVTIAFALFLASYDGETSMGTKTLAYIGILLFFFMSIFGILRLLSAKPALVVTDIGIVDNSTPYAAGGVKWSEIKSMGPYGMRLYGIKTRLVLGIKLKDRDSVLSRHRHLRKALLGAHMKLNEAFGWPHVVIPMDLLDISEDELRTVVEGHLEV